MRMAEFEAHLIGAKPQGHSAMMDKGALSRALISQAR